MSNFYVDSFINHNNIITTYINPNNDTKIQILNVSKCKISTVYMRQICFVCECDTIVLIFDSDNSYLNDPILYECHSIKPPFGSYVREKLNINIDGIFLDTCIEAVGRHSIQSDLVIDAIQLLVSILLTKVMLDCSKEMRELIVKQLLRMYVQ